MIFLETPLRGAMIIELEPHFDERGFFARSWCTREFAASGLNRDLVQCNIAASKKRGTLRGMHYQMSPHGECKLVRCTAGKVYDVIVDIRPDSSTYRQWFGLELSADTHRMLYVPEGFAHGYQVLADNSEVFYQMSQFYSKEASRGIRWNDPAVGIRWPIEDPILSEQDRQLPLISA